MQLGIILIMLHVLVLNARYLLVELEGDNQGRIEGKGLNWRSIQGRNDVPNKQPTNSRGYDPLSTLVIRSSKKVVGFDIYIILRYT